MPIIPFGPSKPVADIIARLEAVKAEAVAGGYEKLAYHLEVALVEARHQKLQAVSDLAGQADEADDPLKPIS